MITFDGDPEGYGKTLLETMTKSLACIVVLLTILSACRKDKECPVTTPTPTDGRDRFVGTYTVYDTLGAYLYQFTISKFGSAGRDSLLLNNFADTFDLKILHERYFTTDFLSIGINYPALDQAGHRWALFGASGENGLNTIADDTIRLGFTMDNIAFFSEDGVSYFSCECRQVAVRSN